MSEIKVNKISPRTACGTTTLGDSGDTFTIPSGVTITNNGTANGFGATGAVNWQTTVKTSGFTAVAGEGYFVNTTSGAISVNLPAGTAGAVVGFKDYANTFDTGNVTLVQNGSDKIGGSTVNATLSTEGQAVTLVFIDSTQGWLVTDSGLQSDVPTAEFIAATGGTITTVCTNFKVHTFTGPGTFCVSAAGNAAGSNTVEYLVVAGGGAGGADLGGGGGAGGFRTVFPSPASGGLPVTATGYPVTVGAGGAPQSSPNPTGGARGNSGSNSVFTGSSTITSAGGGGGGGAPVPQGEGAGANGGSGGGTSGYAPTPTAGGLGNQPPTPVSQGNNGGAGGGAGSTYPGAGGGGAGAVGGTPPNSSSPGSAGGAGTQLNIDSNNYYWAGGGGGSAYTNGNGGPGGIGGGGGGGTDFGPSGAGTGSGGGSAINSGTAGTTGPTSGGPVVGGAGGANSGGGGGAGGHGGTSGVQPFNKGGNGGSGIVIIRYKFQ
jgi:hypothetical protein